MWDRHHGNRNYTLMGRIAFVIRSNTFFANIISHWKILSSEIKNNCPYQMSVKLRNFFDKECSKLYFLNCTQFFSISWFICLFFIFQRIIKGVLHTMIFFTFHWEHAQKYRRWIWFFASIYLYESVIEWHKLNIINLKKEVLKWLSLWTNVVLKQCVLKTTKGFLMFYCHNHTRK